MQDVIFQWMDAINGILWSNGTLVVLLGSGILFTIWTKFSQFTALTHGVQVIRGVYDDANDPGAINHFQALSAALSGTVGLGNIGGVALAIGMGGPGALFWMWVVGFLGMAIKTVEITLAMMYRRTDDPENPHGGAMWVVDATIGKKGLGGWIFAKILGGFFCITCIISSITGGNMFQTWNVADLTERYFGFPRVGVGILLAVLTGLVIIGGIKRIGNVAGRLVPFMCGIYILSGLAVLLVNASQIPEMFGLILKGAFSPMAAEGAFLGTTMIVALRTGLQRAMFSNEAGQGSSPIAHAAAKTDEPAREGFVGGLEPFVDTILVCSLTAMVILVTDTWNREPLGEMNGTVELVATDTGSKLIAPTAIADLPPQPGGEAWIPGLRVYFIAETPNAANADIAPKQRVEIEGTIVEESGERVIRWNEPPASAQWLKDEFGKEIKGIYRRMEGSALTSLAYDRQFPGLGKWMVTLSVWLFAFSTLISWSYYGEQATIYLLGSWAILPYKIVYVLSAAITPIFIRETTELLAVIDFGTGAMLWGNLPIVLGLGYLAVNCLNDYRRRLHAGEMERHAAPPITDVVEGRDIERHGGR